MFSLSGEILTARLRKLTFAAMLRQEVAWFDEERNAVGALCSKLSGDASAIQGVRESLTFYFFIDLLSAGFCSSPFHSYMMEISNLFLNL